MTIEGLIFLDRDGVLNEMVVNQEHGLIDSPLTPDQVVLIDGIPDQLAELCKIGFQLWVVTNQPAAAKGKTSLENLKAVHEKVIRSCELSGAKISGSEICYHRSEEQCECRKPKTKMFEKILLNSKVKDKARMWMVGDGITDIEAGKRFGIKTAFLGPKKCDHCKLIESKNLLPDIWADSFVSFVSELKLQMRKTAA